MENLTNIKGYVTVEVLRAKTGLIELVHEGPNTINADLKDAMAETMHSSSDFALDNLQATQIEQAALSAGANGKDALYIGANSLVDHDSILAIMASAVHPTDSDGSYYRQWQGVWQNLTGVTKNATGGAIGQGYVNSAGGSPQTTFITLIYASTTFSNVAMLANDIMTFNWQISVG